MLIGYAPTGMVPIGYPTFDSATVVEFTGFLDNPQDPRGYLLEVEAVTAEGVFFPAEESVETQYYSAGVTVPLLNGEFWKPRIASGSVRLSMSAPFPSFIQGSGESNATLTLQLDDSDSSVTERTYRFAKVYVGRDGDPFEDYLKVYDGPVNSVTWDRDGRFTFNLGEGTPGAKQRAIFNADGFAIGRPRNVTPEVKDAGLLIYGIHGGSTQAIQPVYDKGIPLNNAGDVADLTTTTVEPGEYKTDLASGELRLGAKAQGAVTADVEGLNDDPTVGFVDTVGNAMRHLMTAANVEASSVDNLNSDVPEHISMYSRDTPTTVVQMISSLASSMGVYYWFNRDGLLEARQFAFGPVAFDFDDTMVSVFQKGVSPVPPMPVEQEYARSWTVQTDNSLAAGVDPVHQEFVSNSVRIATKSAADLKQHYIGSVALRLAGGYIDDPGQDNKFVQRIEDLLRNQEPDPTTGLLTNPPRSSYSMTIPDRTFQWRLEPGMTIRYTPSGFGMSSPMRLIVVSVTESIEGGNTNVSLWG